MGQICSWPWGERDEEDKYGPSSFGSDILLVVITAFLNCIFLTRGVKLLLNSTETFIESRDYLHYWFRQENIKNIWTRESPYDGYTSDIKFSNVAKMVAFLSNVMQIELSLYLSTNLKGFTGIPTTYIISNNELIFLRKSCPVTSAEVLFF